MYFGIPNFWFSTQNKYGRLMLKAFYVRPSEFIIVGPWKYNMLNLMITELQHANICNRISGK